jgi:hypothetical protein
VNANLTKRFPAVKLVVAAWLAAASLAAQDPAEPAGGKPPSKSAPAPAGAIPRQSVDEKALRATIEELAACGTRHSLSSWEDSKRGIGCGRDRIVGRLTKIAKDRRQAAVVVDRFEATAPRTRTSPPA